MAPRSPPRAPPRGFKLFGVQLSDPPPPSMRKSFSLDHLPCLDPAPSSLPLDGYASDGLVHTNSSNCERKKGVPWTEEEHRLFLLGLQKLGKGDWRGISRSFVKTRTPTQVASHAQKYFLRRNNLNKRRRRSSLFDITPDTVSSLPEESLLEETGCELAIGSHGTHELNLMHRGRGEESVHVYPIGGFPLSLSLYPLPCMPAHVPKIRHEPIEAVETEDLEDCQMSMFAGDNFSGPSGSISVIDTAPESQGEVNQSNLPSLFPMYSVEKEGSWSSECKIVKPSPISTPVMSVDDSMRLSELSFGTSRPVMEPTPLSYKLSADRPRHSAFHPMSSVHGSESNAISVP